MYGKSKEQEEQEAKEQLALLKDILFNHDHYWEDQKISIGKKLGMPKGIEIMREYFLKNQQAIDAILDESMPKPSKLVAPSRNRIVRDKPSAFRFTNDLQQLMVAHLQDTKPGVRKFISATFGLKKNMSGRVYEALQKSNDQALKDIQSEIKAWDANHKPKKGI